MKILVEKTSLVLLCNINPAGIINSNRNNLSDRIKDFEKSLPFWLNLNFFKNIIIVENSGYKGDLFKKYINKSKNKKKIELVIYDGQNFNRKLGKGYGAYQQVSRVLKYSKNAKKSEYFVLVTGRYVIKNIKKILFGVKSDIMCDLVRNLTFATGMVTFASKSFVVKYWLKFMSKTNDSQGRSGEHQQAKAVLRAISEGYSWQLPSEHTQIDGISGFANIPYVRNNFYELILKYYFYLKKFVFEFRR